MEVNNVLQPKKGNSTTQQARKSRLTTVIKNLKQLTRPEGKVLLTDTKYTDFADLMQEEDFIQERYREAAKKYQKQIKITDYQNISMYDIGLNPAIDEEKDIMQHFRFMYG